MSGARHQLDFSQAELVALYVALSGREAELDEVQTAVLDRVAATLYAELSVSEMEDITGYYQGLLQPLRDRGPL